MELQVEECGTGSPVLLLHGCPSPVSDFAPIVERLRGTHRVIAPYLPGYGTSPALKPYSLVGARDAIVESLLARDVRRVAVVGFSTGAMHAFGLATDSRLEVTCVIGLAGLAEYPEREQMLGFIAMLRSGADLSTPDWRAMAGQRFTSKPELADKVADWLTVTTPEVMADELEAGLDSGLLDRLSEVRVPITLRVGTLDVAAPIACAEAIVARCPHAKIESVPGVAHALCLEDPVGTAEFVARVLGEVHIGQVPGHPVSPGSHR